MIAALCAVALVAACDDGGVETIDSGRPMVNRDSSPATDAVVEPEPEAGPTDAGADAAADLDGAPDGACTVAGPVAPFGVSCAATTLDCLETCMDGGCQTACIEADPEPDICLNCVLGNLTSCVQTRGCQDEWDGYYCCVEAAGCFDLAVEEARTCATTACGGAFTAYQACSNPLQAECFPVQRMCFPP